MRFPSTLIEFQDRFPDEESCWQYLRRVRWPHGFRCPRCQGRESSFIRTRRLEQCRRCRYQASVTAGTVFHKTRVGLRVWLLGIFFVARHKKGISALQFQRDTGLGSYQTAWTLLHKLRSSLGRRTGELLSGLVEADEAYVGGPLALVKTGDPIELDVEKKIVNLKISEGEFKTRQQAWRRPAPKYGRSYGAIFSRHVKQANEGCDFDFLEGTAPTAEPEIH